jgi:hypothetical protein
MTGRGRDGSHGWQSVRWRRAHARLWRGRHLKQRPQIDEVLRAGVVIAGEDLQRNQMAGSRHPHRQIRQDLYYRLSVFEIGLPPLRDRREDILLLAEAFLKEVGSGVGRPAAGISEDARQQLLRYRWPGNVRELRNAVERAVILLGLPRGQFYSLLRRYGLTEARR